MTGLPDLREDDWIFLETLSVEPDGTGYVFATQDRDDLLTVGLVRTLPSPRIDPYGMRVELTEAGREAIGLRAATLAPSIDLVEAEEVETGFDFEALLARPGGRASTGPTIDLRAVDLDAAA